MCFRYACRFKFRRGADAIWPQTWVYPSLPAGVSELLPGKSGLLDKAVASQFRYTRFRDHWVYIITSPCSSGGLPDVRGLSVAVAAKVFNPEKYEALLGQISTLYAASGSTANVLQAYLTVLTKESFTFPNGTAFDLAKYDDRRAMLQGPLKEVISTFGLESILLVTAVLLKKRVMMYSARQDTILKFVRVMPMFAAHRQNWSILRPDVSFTEVEVAELNAAAVYVAGTTDVSARSHEELFDLFVDSAPLFFAFFLC